MMLQRVPFFFIGIQAGWISLLALTALKIVQALQNAHICNTATTACGVFGFN